MKCAFFVTKADCSAVRDSSSSTWSLASTGSLLFGLGANSDASLTGSIVLNERNFDVGNPEMNQPDVRTEPGPGALTPRGSISLPTTNAKDKSFYFRFDIGYYRMR
jgi:hypothetical protein